MTNTMIDLISSELDFNELKNYVSNHISDYANYIKEEMFIIIYKLTKNKIIVSDIQTEFFNRLDLIKEAMI